MSVQGMPVTNRPAAFERVNPRSARGDTNPEFHNRVHVGWASCWVPKRYQIGIAERKTPLCLLANAYGITNSVTIFSNGTGSLPSHVTAVQCVNSLSGVTTADKDSDGRSALIYSKWRLRCLVA